MIFDELSVKYKLFGIPLFCHDNSFSSNLLWALRTQKGCLKIKYKILSSYLCIYSVRVHLLLPSY